MLNLRLFGPKDRNAGGAADGAPPPGIVPHEARLAMTAADIAPCSLPDTGPDAAGEAAAEGSALDDFIYLVSHDLRASMRALLEVPVWIAEDLQEAGIALPAGVQEHLSLLDRHTGRLDRMLCDLLAYSRAGRLQREVTVDVADALAQVLDALPVPEGWRIYRDIGHPSVDFGDRDILTLFDALISNAIKHKPGPGGTIWIRTREEAGEFVLTVTDDGPGIPAEHRASVFEVMRTLRPRDQVEGSGMGLALVEKLARIYGGSVSAHPAYGSADRGGTAATPGGDAAPVGPEGPEVSGGSGRTGTTIRFAVPSRRAAPGIAA